jgi:lipoyl(octanoyl) transferase
VTSHGFALNVNTNLSYFQMIVPCGITDKGVTSMARLLGRSLDLDKVAAVAAKQFGDVFDRDLTINTSVDGA